MTTNPIKDITVEKVSNDITMIYIFLNRERNRVPLGKDYVPVVAATYSVDHPDIPLAVINVDVDKDGAIIGIEIIT